MLSAVALVDGKLLAQHLELGDQLRIASEHQLRLDPELDGAEPQLLEASRFELERERPERLHTGAAPERERRARSRCAPRRESGSTSLLVRSTVPLELERIDVLRSATSR